MDRHNAEGMGKCYGHPVVPLEREDIRGVNRRLVCMLALMKLNAVMWSAARPNEQEKGLFITSIILSGVEWGTDPSG